MPCSSIPGLTLYPINPLTSAHYRQAFTPSGASDDLPDARVLLELVRDHAFKLRPLEPQDPATVELAGLVELRRDWSIAAPRCSISSPASCAIIIPKPWNWWAS